MAAKRLGRGLEALIHGPEGSDLGHSGVTDIPIENIVTNPLQPRKDGLDEKSLEELIASIKQKGVITPITVQQDKDNFILIAGERRLRASRLAGLKRIPGYVITISDESEMMEIALIENIQRENLNPIDEAEGFAILQSKFKRSQGDIASAVGKQRVTIANALRLLKLPSDIKNSLRDRKISAGHGRAILGMKTTAGMMKLYKMIIEKDLSVRVAEAFTKGKSTKKSKHTRSKSVGTNHQIRSIENELISVLGTKVRLHHSKKGGKIEIQYFSDDDLDRVLDLLRSIE